MLPNWLADSPPLPAIQDRRRSRFLEKTLSETARFVEAAVFAEQVARRPGFLQQLEARAKLIAFLGLTVTAAFIHHLLPLWIIGGFTIIAALASHLRGRELLHRVWWTMPGMFVLLAAPAALSVITPGVPAITIWRHEGPLALGPIPIPAALTITTQGLASAGLVASRIIIGVLLALILTLTTRWQDLLRAGYNNVTATFVLILAMMHRYLFLLLRVVEHMQHARRARTIIPQTAAADRGWIGSRVGALFLRSRRLTEQVYAAMLARGYTGEPRSLTSVRWGLPEVIWLGLCGGLAALALYYDRCILAAGRW